MYHAIAMPCYGLVNLILTLCTVLSYNVEIKRNVNQCKYVLGASHMSNMLNCEYV